VTRPSMREEDGPPAANGLPTDPVVQPEQRPLLVSHLGHRDAPV
jgi:hypothetical protein